VRFLDGSKCGIAAEIRADGGTARRQPCAAAASTPGGVATPTTANDMPWHRTWVKKRGSPVSDMAFAVFHMIEFYHYCMPRAERVAYVMSGMPLRGCAIKCGCLARTLHSTMISKHLSLQQPPKTPKTQNQRFVCAVAPHRACLGGSKD